MVDRRSRRRTAGACSLIAVLALLCAPPAGAATHYTVVGHGWGHGVGMGQYGALGYALHGVKAHAMLRHYYQGTRIGHLRAVRRERVLLASGSSLAFACAGRIGVTDRETGRRVVLGAGVYRMELGKHGGLRVRDRVTEHRVIKNLSPSVKVSPLTSRRLRLDSAASNGVVSGHWRGRFDFTRSGDGILLVDAVRLEPYLRGVVPSEMPSTWPRAALRAQAIAARSYAVATRDSGRLFDAYADTRSQVFGPVEHEASSTTAAVSATADQVVVYGSHVATTYFSSSTGGRSASPISGFGSSTRVPYLRSVRDPYDAARGHNPNHTWRVVLRRDHVVAALGAAPGRFETLRYRPSRRVHELLLHPHPGSTVALSGLSVEGRLGLRSTYFKVRRAGLHAPSPIRRGHATRLEGSIWPRFAERVTILHRQLGRSWARVYTVRVHADGSFHHAIHPRHTSEYRLAIVRADSPTIRVRVG